MFMKVITQFIVKQFIYFLFYTAIKSYNVGMLLIQQLMLGQDAIYPN